MHDYNTYLSSAIKITIKKKKKKNIRKKWQTRPQSADFHLKSLGSPKKSVKGIFKNLQMCFIFLDRWTYLKKNLKSPKMALSTHSHKSQPMRNNLSNLCLVS